MSIKQLIIFFVFIAQTKCIVYRRVITTLNYSKSYSLVKLSVVDGRAAIEGQVPHMVSIKEPAKAVGNAKLWIHLCGGSIIEKSKVVTAAHCFETDNFLYLQRPYLLRLVAGNLNTRMYVDGVSTNTRDAQWREIVTVKLHPKFHFPMNDIAVLTTDHPWEFTYKVHAVDIATEDLYQPSCIVAGFGDTQFRKNKASSVLLLGKIRTLTKRQCSALWEINMDSFVCTLSATTDVSHGDSGGPLTCSLRSGDEVLFGIVSGKNFDATTLFTRVSAYADFIKGKSSCTCTQPTTSSLLCMFYALVYFFIIYIIT